ncbi:uveal autoantigen with coiled-coil domains and ankyrin repeats isoform 2 [Reticulomyxa filosa]|uniref:Uveal autoantigen with coiled-coil domains and ankyrin repeats isoform 2 n=1 Tax=Reticulomyxa filosa TaxID=46433 RepID=X6NTR3_RETFI|nr:uveal autoantigen with coiled-coil domains and ankyrin repeats isoform 2 [Reticulomyxa filosa]ETO29344.1 uveal autoantigen with coiled-coil domains and ankyrin repeats isoform 2 [Reticulomyxa filosa]|eukprot:ETO29343.1 uveal autoantigen with coiled-coil domains and ankyrin repeats isoform 2 [Reticulomyxa filosa]
MNWWFFSGPQQQQSQQSQRQEQEVVQKQDVAMQQILLEQMDDCFSIIKRYLNEVLRVIRLQEKATNKDTQALEMANMRMAQSVNLLQISLKDCYQEKDNKSIELAQAKVTEFYSELNLFMESLRNKDEINEIEKRLMPIRNNLVRIVRNENVPLNPGSKLNKKTFNEKTVGFGFGQILGAGHQIRDRMEEVSKNPNAFYNAQEKMKSNSKRQVNQLLSIKTQKLDKRSMMHDIDCNNLDEDTSKEITNVDGHSSTGSKNTKYDSMNIDDGRQNIDWDSMDKAVERGYWE